jgi:hypothetical protein
MHWVDSPGYGFVRHSFGGLEYRKGVSRCQEARTRLRLKARVGDATYGQGAIDRRVPGAQRRAPFGGTEAASSLCQQRGPVVSPDAPVNADFRGRKLVNLLDLECAIFRGKTRLSGRQRLIVFRARLLDWRMLCVDGSSRALRHVNVGKLGFSAVFCPAQPRSWCWSLARDRYAFAANRAKKQSTSWRLCETTIDQEQARIPCFHDLPLVLAFPWHPSGEVKLLIVFRPRKSAVNPLTSPA